MIYLFKMQSYFQWNFLRGNKHHLVHTSHLGDLSKNKSLTLGFVSDEFNHTDFI